MAPREDVRLIHTCWPFDLSTVGGKGKQSENRWEDMKATEKYYKRAALTKCQAFMGWTVFKLCMIYNSTVNC